MTFYIALAAAVGAALSLVLHALGARYPKAETAAEYVDKGEALVKEAQDALPK